MIDAAGKLITPGFINMHSHSDCSAAMYPQHGEHTGAGHYHGICGALRSGGGPGTGRLALYVSGEKGIHQGHAGAARGYQPIQRLSCPHPASAGALCPGLRPGAGLDHLWPVPGSLRRVGLGANLAVVAGQAQIRLQAMGLAIAGTPPSRRSPPWRTPSARPWTAARWG